MCWRTRGEEGGMQLDWAALQQLFNESVVCPTPYGVCNELAIGSVIGEKYRLFLSTSSSLRVSTLRTWQQYWTLWQALVKPSISFHSSSHSPFLPLTQTPAVFLSLPPPLFSFHYIFISLSWESSPPHRWKGKGVGSRHPRGKQFNSESKLSRGQRHSPLMG